jgi:predicted TIM-barrel fold metal-dependent hydrolase
MEVIMPQESPPIDAHCHLFNVFYLTSEITEILWDMVWGNYPHRTEGLKAMSGVDSEGIREWFQTLMGQISQLSHSAFGSYEDNFSLLTRAYQQSFQTDEKLVMYPLMMDIHYMAAKPCSASLKQVGEDLKGSFVKDRRQLFDELFGELKTAVVKRGQEVLPSQMAAAKALSVTFSSVDVEQKLDDIYKEVTTPPSDGLKAAISDGVELSKGFVKQVRALLELRKAHPDTVFPFFAVDPRRAGIMDVITKSHHFLATEAPLVGKNGPFFGIKLYPRLGYRPMDVQKECPDLYKWCRDNDIPITIHCSLTGFPLGQNSGYGDFGSPENWKEVLTLYPELRINLAHFGHNGDGWKDIILDLMKKPGNNVYTDLSCYTEEETLKEARSVLETNDALKGRLMFGTDFDVMLTTDFITLANYFEQFKTVFSDGQMVDMSRRVPSLFLNQQRPTFVKEATRDTVHGEQEVIQGR